MTQGEESMDRTKIPFDFGLAHGKYECRKHGEQNGGLVITIGTFQDRPAIERVFCGRCLIEILESVTAPMQEI